MVERAVVGRPPGVGNCGQWHSSVLRCATMDVSVRELRNHTARVIGAVQGGERVVLTVHGRPVADIVPHARRSERRSSEQLLAELRELAELAERLDARSEEADFDVGLTTDDMSPAALDSG